MKYLVRLVPCVPFVHIGRSNIICWDDSVLATGLYCHVAPAPRGRGRDVHTMRSEFHRSNKSPNQADFTTHDRSIIENALFVGRLTQQRPSFYSPDTTVVTLPKGNIADLTRFGVLPWRAGRALNPRIPWSGM